jgi:hypothetical protein
MIQRSQYVTALIPYEAASTSPVNAGIWRAEGIEIWMIFDPSDPRGKLLGKVLKRGKTSHCRHSLTNSRRIATQCREGGIGI